MILFSLANYVVTRVLNNTEIENKEIQEKEQKCKIKYQAKISCIRVLYYQTTRCVIRKIITIIFDNPFFSISHVLIKILLQENGMVVFKSKSI